MKRILITIVCLLMGFTLTVHGLTAQVHGAELRFLAVGHPAPLTTYLNDVVIPEFEEKHGVKVFVDTANWNTRMDKILVSIAGGVPYDVVATGYYSPYEEGSMGLLEPLDQYVDQWDKTAMFPEPLWEATKWQGQIFHIPHSNDLRGIAYNKRLFSETGLDAEAPPDSWESLIQAARRLTRIDGDHVSVRGYQNISTEGGSAQELFWYMHQAGVSEINLEDFTSNLNREEARSALRMLLELSEATRFREPIVPGGFTGERIAMTRHSAISFATMREQNPLLVESYGIFTPRRSPQSAPVAHGFVNGLAILAASKHKDLAWEFISALHEDDVRFEIDRISGFLSGRIDLVLPMMDVVPKIELFYDLFTHLKATIIPPPRNISQNEVGNRILQVYNMQISPEAALDRGHELWTRLLGEWKETLSK